MHILFTTDGKKHSETALHFAGNLFRSANVQCTAIHVHSSAAKESLEKAKRHLVTAGRVLSEYSLKPTLKLILGDTIPNIIAQAEKGRYDLLVLGSQNNSLLEGSVMKGVAEELFREDGSHHSLKNIGISILAVKNASDELNRVLLCTDGSVYSENALRFWGGFKRIEEPKAVLLNIIPEVVSRFSDEVKNVEEDLLKVYTHTSGPQAMIVNRGKEILRKYGIKVTAKLRVREYAAEEILDEARDGNYDLVVIGYRGREGRGKQIGSQALEVIKYAQAPVLVYQERAH